MSKTRILELMGNKGGKITNVFFDMDGVLADFEGGLPQSDASLQALKQEYDRLSNSHPATKGKSRDVVKKMFKGMDLTGDDDLRAIKKALRKYDSAVFSFANRKGFFLNLKPLPGAKDMLIKAKEITGVKPHILTAPVLSNPNCESEKEQWLKKHFPGMYDKFICTIHKNEYGSEKNAILIDDRDKYVEKFRDGGGHAIQYLNNPKETMEKLKNWFDSVPSEEGDTELKYSGIIKLKVPVTTDINRAIKVSENNGLTALDSDKFHVTLLARKSFKDLVPYMGELDLSDIDVVTPIYNKRELFISKREDLNKVSSFLEIENQGDFQKMVAQIINKLLILAKRHNIDWDVNSLSDYDKSRFFHVSIANKDGNPYSSIGDIKQSDKWYPVSLKGV